MNFTADNTVDHTYYVIWSKGKNTDGARTSNYATLSKVISTSVVTAPDFIVSDISYKLVAQGSTYVTDTKERSASFF